MGGGLESRCVGRVYGADGAVHSTIRTVHTIYELVVRELPNNKAPNLNNKKKPAFNGRGSDLMFFYCVDFPFNTGTCS